MRTQGMLEVAPVGATLNNGLDVGGGRIYPFSRSLAFSPPAMYSNYVGSAIGNPINPPVSALANTTGALGNTSGSGQAVSSPLSAKHSPLPWIVLGVLGILYVMHRRGYSAGGGE